MKFGRKIFILFAALTVLALTGCNKINQIKNIKMTGCSLESVTPVGMKGIKAQLAVGIDNPAMQFTVSDINGIVYYQDSELIHYTANPITVDKHCSAVYPVTCSGTVADNVSVSKLLSLLVNSSIEDYTVDINVKLALKGASKSIKIKKKPLKDFMEDK
ncbi:MAG: hypothetical protein J5520_05295 [Bacteroidales bacterium]|jgi:hypothetical protein|nr:hypothetical protein [Bacteroidales bacterium]MCR5243344.1 hypothetical protein [Bacteroidales bacterium]MDT3356468.1 hypothetical protein [Bacteroidota bacterium]